MAAAVVGEGWPGGKQDRHRAQSNQDSLVLHDVVPTVSGSSHERVLPIWGIYQPMPQT